MSNQNGSFSASYICQTWIARKVKLHIGQIVLKNIIYL